MSEIEDPSSYLSSDSAFHRRKSFIVWRKSQASTGVGFFSIVTSVLAQLRLAEERNLIPVVDFETHFSTYQEREPIHGTRNMWEYYFEQPAGRKLPEVEKNADRSDGTHPRGFAYDLSRDPRYKELWDKYIRLNSQTQSFVETSISELQLSHKTLGVHFRGGDMRTARGHKFPPTQKQLNQAIQSVLDSSDVDTIFLVTEGKQYEKSLKKKWGHRLKTSPSFRLSFRNSYASGVYPRPHHRYRLGLETLRDAIALSRCGGLVCGRSNLSEASLMLGADNLKPAIRISQGSNSGHPLVAPFLWYAKAVLPQKLGGFKNFDK